MYKTKALFGRITIAVLLMTVTWMVLSAPFCAAESFSTYTTTAQFNSGTAINITTETARYNISAGNIELDFPYAAKDTSADQLISYWRFEGDATDETGLVDGSAAGMAYTDGKFGQGNNRKAMTVANNSLLSPATRGMTVSGWFNREASVVGNYMIYTQGSSNLIQIFMGANYTIQAYSNYGADEEQTMTTGTYEADCWYHIAATYEIATNYWRIYVNGTPAAQIVTTNGTLTTHVFDADLTIGNIYMITDEVKFYTRSLTASEILGLYNSGNQYETSGSWQSPIIEKPDLDTISNIGITVSGAGNYSNITKIAIINAVTGAELSNITRNITESGQFSFSDFSNGLLCTRNHVVKVRVYLEGVGNATATISSITVNHEPGSTFSAGTQGTTERIYGAIHLKKGINRVVLKWTGPEVDIVRWNLGDGSGDEGVSLSHVYTEAGDYEITAIGYKEDGDRLWCNATVSFAANTVLLDSSSNHHHFTVTNVTLFSSGAVMIITASLYPDIKLLFKWNNSKFRMTVGAILIFLGVVFTPGILPAGIVTGLIRLFAGVI